MTVDTDQLRHDEHKHVLLHDIESARRAFIVAAEHNAPPHTLTTLRTRLLEANVRYECFMEDAHASA